MVDDGIVYLLSMRAECCQLHFAMNAVDRPLSVYYAVVVASCWR